MVEAGTGEVVSPRVFTGSGESCKEKLHGNPGTSDPLAAVDQHQVWKEAGVRGTLAPSSWAPICYGAGNQRYQPHSVR